jgi:DNA adenine methylase
LARSRAPFWWYGGKGMMIAKLKPLIPPHRTYVEPFCGAASMLFAKEPAAVETINDLHSGVAGFFRVLRDQPDEFMRLARLSEYGRELYNECRATWQDETDPVRRAWKWWYVAATSFSGRWGSSLSTVVTHSCRGMASTCSKLQSRVEDVLPVCIERLRHVQIENMDALTVIDRYCSDDGFCYCDPPYVGESRAASGYDNQDSAGHDMRATDLHASLVSALLAAPGAVLLSGYAHEVYDPLILAGWERIDWQTSCHAAGRTRATSIQGAGSATAKQARVESVWLNPKLQALIGPLAYACLGSNARIFGRDVCDLVLEPSVRTVTLRDQGSDEHGSDPTSMD